MADARKAPIGRDGAFKLAEQVDEIYVARGSKTLYIDLRRGSLDRDELADLILGPTGNLRAPTIRQGRTLVVGFDEPTYAKVLPQA